MIYGYARVSTQEQDTAMQISAFKVLGVEKIFEEKASGARYDRPVLWRCLDTLRTGDQLVVYKLDRIARSLADLLRILDKIERAGASIRSVTEPIDTCTATDRLMLQILGAMAEFERSLIREPTFEEALNDLTPLARALFILVRSVNRSIVELYTSSSSKT